MKLGKMAEQLAQQYLKDNNYEIIGTNIRDNKIEIDIIARHGDLIVIVEVKSRKSLSWFQIQKQQKTNINNFIMKHYGDQYVRIDLLLICDKKIHHMKNIYL